MAELHVVTGLVSKRAEVAGQIASHKTEITLYAFVIGRIDESRMKFAGSGAMDSIDHIFRQRKTAKINIPIVRTIQAA